MLFISSIFRYSPTDQKYLNTRPAKDFFKAGRKLGRPAGEHDAAIKMQNLERRHFPISVNWL